MSETPEVLHNKIVIIVRDGEVQDVLATQPTSVAILDYDLPATLDEAGAWELPTEVSASYLQTLVSKYVELSREKELEEWRLHGITDVDENEDEKNEGCS